jgi:hypothetical protein
MSAIQAVNDPTPAELARFQSKYRPVGDCLLWTGHKDKDGYGVFLFRRAMRKAHRMALWLANRPIPPGFVVNHTCRRRACVNPQHLTTISASENSKRDSNSPAYVNSQKTHCKLGHPFDRYYPKRAKPGTGERYCSICESAKGKRLRAKWKAEGILKI